MLPYKWLYFFSWDAEEKHTIISTLEMITSIGLKTNSYEIMVFFPRKHFEHLCGSNYTGFHQKASEDITLWVVIC